MRFRNRQQNSSTPEVNLVPMMDVMMSVLTFFIITSMSFTGQRLGNINLPGLPGTQTGAGEQADQTAQESLDIGLNRQGEILLDNQVITVDQLAEKMRSFLAQNPQGTVVLKADRELPYEQVTKLLQEMSKIGGSRVSLAIERR
ncbi:MAG: biopolymer transporter ExbD [Cyanobacteriota bacterium]